MMTLSKSNGLWTGSLQKHMAVSRRQMNKSYGLQQAQLARMNIVRDSQRLQLSAADTLVRLEQLKEEIKKNQYKSLPKVETLGVIPNSNPALESTLTNSGSQTEVEEEPLEEKRAPPTLAEPVAARAKSAPTSRAVTPDKKFKNKGGLTVEIPTKKAISPIKKDTKVSPTPSQAATVDTSTTAQQSDSPTTNEARFVQLKAQILKYAEKDPTFKDSFNYPSFAKSNPKKKEKVLKSIGYAENLLNNYESKKQPVGDGLGRMRKRGKGGRFISKR